MHERIDLKRVGGESAAEAQSPRKRSCMGLIYWEAYGGPSEKRARIKVQKEGGKVEDSIWKGLFSGIKRGGRFFVGLSLRRVELWRRWWIFWV